MGHAPIGIIANPASGKDIRRLVARASVFDNQEKRNMVVRAVLGAVAAGAREFLYLPDAHGIVASGLDECGDVNARPVASPMTDSALDTVRAARAMREAGCAVVVTLGGDGTNRAAALGWRDVPLIPLSTGTNNVFPRMVEATLAGAAAGLVATGAVERDPVSLRTKTVTAEIEDEKPDLALIDAALVDAGFTGTRAVWETDSLRALVLTRAEPAAVGLSSIGGLTHPLTAAEDEGLFVRFGREPRAFELDAPIAPGLYRRLFVAEVRTLSFGEQVAIAGPGVIALDGERERRLRAGQSALLSVDRDGPYLIDIDRVLRLAACRGAFRLPRQR